MSLEPIKIGSLTCIPLHPLFAAEIRGVDFSQNPLPDHVIQDIITAQDRFGVTVYRDTGLNDKNHIAFSRQLGDPELRPRFSNPNELPRFPEPELFDIGNMDRDGNLVLKGTRRWWFNKGNALWHTDSSYNQLRSKYSLLLAHQLPTHGGNTNYADVRSAYNDLPQEKKDEIEDLVACHNLWHSRKIAAPEEFKSVNEWEISQKPPAYHKLVQTTADGRKTLYIAAHGEYIVGKPKDEGLKLINELLEHCTQPKYTICIQWKTPGDLVFWDNRCTMHRATPFSDQMEKRDMRRTTILDDSPTARGVDYATLNL